jgi:hypothetical protein
MEQLLGTLNSEADIDRWADMLRRGLRAGRVFDVRAIARAPKRSTAGQKRIIHFLIDCIARYSGHSRAEVRDILRQEIGPLDFLDEAPSALSSRDLGTDWASEYIERLLNYIGEREIPVGLVGGSVDRGRRSEHPNPVEARMHERAQREAKGLGARSCVVVEKRECAGRSEVPQQQAGGLH